MSSRWRVPILLAVLVTLAGVAIPPVIEDHLEPGFCSGDCPVQLAGHGVAITPPPTPSAVRRAAVVAPAVTVGAATDLGTVALPDAPRAPPSV